MPNKEKTMPYMFGKSKENLTNKLNVKIVNNRKNYDRVVQPLKIKNSLME